MLAGCSPPVPGLKMGPAAVTETVPEKEGEQSVWGTVSVL